MQKVIIIRGTPASGKSTIGKKYRNFENRTIWLKVDNFKDFFDTFASEARSFIHGAANASLEYFLKEGFSVVMEGVFQDQNYIQQAITIIKKYNIPYKVFQTKVSLKTLQERDKMREGVPEGWRKPLGDKEIAQIYSVLEESPYPDAIILDTEKMSLDECITFIDKHFEL